MNTLRKMVQAILLAVPLLLAAQPAAVPTKAGSVQAQKKQYVCPMKEHTTVFDKPGECPECGMALIEKDASRNVAILIFDHVKSIDWTPEYEIFSNATYNVYTVAPEKKPIKAQFGLQVIPDFDFASAPAPDVLIIPGGGEHQADLPAPWAHGLPIPDDPKILGWVRKSAEHAKVVLSVCNGAFTLARAGLLDGRSATATRNLVSSLAQAGRDLRPVENRRWVEDGKFVTSGGESAGMDGAYHVLSMLEGEDAAARHARGMEYRWDPSGKDEPRPAR